MAIADKIPSLSNLELANLRDNARRLSETGTAQQKAAADELAPLIEAQLAERKARAPAKTKAARTPARPAKPKPASA